MLDLIARAYAGQVEALQGLSALVAIVAIVPSAILFIANQLHQNSLLRNEKYRYSSGQYHFFLEKCLLFPELKLGPYVPVPDNQLSVEQVYQRDTLFDLLTSIFEGAYLEYADRIRSYRRRQWNGWNAYIDLYIERSDYREWWQRVVFDGEKEYLERDDFSGFNVSQYDRRFECYMLGKLKQHPWIEPAHSIGSKRKSISAHTKRRARPR